jgi:hypothetical protein
MRRCVFLLLSVLLLVSPLHAATFYLSPAGSDTGGNGSRQRPWKTIALAAGKIPDDGSSIVLLDGLYEGAQSVDRQFKRPCVIRAENPYRARLRSPAGQNRVLYCYDASNIRFQGLEMFGSGGTRGSYLIHIGTANAHHLTFDDCIIHDGYNNDLIKINDSTHHILFRNCVFYNQTDRGGDEHFDINTVTDIAVEDSIFFNDYAGSGRPVGNKAHSFVVIKNSGDTPDVTRRIAFRRNVFLNWQGKPDQAYILLGEDGQPFFEAQEVLIENNLFLHNSPVQNWGTLLYKGGLKDITFRGNTVLGRPAVKWTGAMSAVCLRIAKNPPMGDLTFANNIFCDPTGRMPQFCDSEAQTFAPGTKQTLINNLYWNAGKAIPTDPKDVLTPARDPKKIVGDPRLGNPNEAVTLPRWDAAKGRFLSGQATVRAEFERLVRRYAALGDGSPAIDAADPADMPADDILGTKRDRRPDIGCFEKSAVR